LFTFGAGQFGEIGTNDQKNHPLPVKVDILKPKKRNPKDAIDPVLDYA